MQTIIDDVAEPLGLVNRQSFKQKNCREDVSLSTLSSFKLLSVLRSDQVGASQLDTHYIDQLQAELCSRGDNQHWCSPH